MTIKIINNNRDIRPYLIVLQHKAASINVVALHIRLIIFTLLIVGYLKEFQINIT